MGRVYCLWKMSHFIGLEVNRAQKVRGQTCIFLFLFIVLWNHHPVDSFLVIPEVFIWLN